MKRPRGQYDDEMDVLSICLELHQEIHQPETMTDERRDELTGFLRHKLAGWSDGLARCRGFDDVVKMLIHVALREQLARCIGRRVRVVDSIVRGAAGRTGVLEQCDYNEIPFLVRLDSPLSPYSVSVWCRDVEEIVEP